MTLLSVLPIRVPCRVWSLRGWLLLFALARTCVVLLVYVLRELGGGGYSSGICCNCCCCLWSRRPVGVVLLLSKPATVTPITPCCVAFFLAVVLAVSPDTFMVIVSGLL